MFTLQTIWEWVGYVDQGLIVPFVPVMILLLVKIRRLETALANCQGAVYVAVSAPSVMPLQTMTTAANRPQAQSIPQQPVPLAFD